MKPRLRYVACFQSIHVLACMLEYVLARYWCRFALRTSLTTGGKEKVCCCHATAGGRGSRSHQKPSRQNLSGLDSAWSCLLQARFHTNASKLWLPAGSSLANLPMCMVACFTCAETHACTHTYASCRIAQAKFPQSSPTCGNWGRTFTTRMCNSWNNSTHAQRLLLRQQCTTRLFSKSSNLLMMR